jgi:hypothetical protein
MHSSATQVEFLLKKEHKIMTTDPTTIAHGTLEENGDTWFLMRPDRMILLDLPFVVDDSLEHKTVSVIGKMGILPSAPGVVKLIVEKLVTHDDISIRAFDIELTPVRLEGSELG